MTSKTLPPARPLDDAKVLAALEASVVRADAAKDSSSGDGRDDPHALSAWQQAGPYLGHVGYFVGAGLISGGIVHYTLDPSRYLLVATAGVAVFLLATVCNEVLLPAAALPRPAQAFPASSGPTPMPSTARQPTRPAASVPGGIAEVVHDGNDPPAVSGSRSGP